MIKIKTPSNLYTLWNVGSIIAINISIQIIIGFILSINYFQNLNLFDASFNIYYNINFGWAIRLLHRNLTSLIFILIFIHLTRNILFQTFFNKKIWWTGIILLIILILISFLGYSLIWNQISYWAIIVITNFISSIPIVGSTIVKWIWGNFNINNILINRFFSIHFIIPLLSIIIILIHLTILHLNKSTNPIGLNQNIDLINLNPIFIIKDFIILFLAYLIFINLNLINPWFFNNPDNFNQINYFKTPNHIEPEWYFLFFYSILRSIENKFSGLLIIFLVILLFLNLPAIIKSKFQSTLFRPLNIIKNIIWINIIIIIAYLGSKPIEYPFRRINRIAIWTFMLYFCLI